MIKNLPIKPLIEHYGGKIPRDVHGWQKIKCPFHDDAHASAGVSTKEGIFVCHGCGIKGNAINIVMEVEGKKYYEAIKIAEGITGESHEALLRKSTLGRRISESSGHRPRSGSTDTIRSRRGATAWSRAVHW